MAEIGDNKAVTAELATMTCTTTDIVGSILEELAICQQDNRDLREELEVAHGRDKLASIELGELRVRASIYVVKAGLARPRKWGAGTRCIIV